MTDREIFKKWAAQKYHLINVESVTLELLSHGPLSDVTPDVESYIDVFIRYNGGRIKRDELTDVHGLIHELVAIGE